MFKIGDTEYQLGQPRLRDLRLIYEFYSYMYKQNKETTKVAVKLIQLLPRLYDEQFTVSTLRNYLYTDETITLESFVTTGLESVRLKEESIREVDELYASNNWDHTGTIESDDDPGSNKASFNEIERIFLQRSQIQELYNVIINESQLMSFSELDGMLYEDYLDYMNLKNQVLVDDEVNLKEEQVLTF